MWPSQIKGVLEGMGVGVGQCVFGTDYPYGIGFWDVDENIAGLVNAEWELEERMGVLYGIVEWLWQGRWGG